MLYEFDDSWHKQVHTFQTLFDNVCDYRVSVKRLQVSFRVHDQSQNIQQEILHYNLDNDHQLEQSILYANTAVVFFDKDAVAVLTLEPYAGQGPSVCPHLYDNIFGLNELYDRERSNIVLDTHVMMSGVQTYFDIYHFGTLPYIHHRVYARY